jgi:tight adherence protein C
LAGIGDWAPFDKEDSVAVRKRLSAAGYRSPGSKDVYYGARIVAMVIAPLATFGLIFAVTKNLSSPWLASLAAVYVGYILPGRYLDRTMRRRREAVNRSLPDFLDLLVIGVESGMALDSAIAAAARDLRRAHPVLCDELEVFGREILAGVTRAAALQSLGARSGEPELRKLTTLLVQADRFGSSISKVLRAQARYMRLQRRQRAEEQAHKVSVKMLFPVIFLIMPSVLLVTAGPAVILLITNLSRMAHGN